MNKKAKKKNPLKLKACAVALSLWGFPPFSLSSAPVMAAETASNTAQEFALQLREAQKELPELQKEDEIRGAMETTLFNISKGVDIAANLHRYEEEVASLNNLITRSGNSHDPKIQEQVAGNLFLEEALINSLHRYKEDIAACNDLIKRFGNSQDKIIQEQVANALYSKGVVLGILHRYEEARAELEELVYRFKDNPDVDIQKDVATARHLLLVTRNL